MTAEKPMPPSNELMLRGNSLCIERSSAAFEFTFDEIFDYFSAHISTLEAEPENHSPHRQIVRGHQRYVDWFVELQSEFHHAVEQESRDTLAAILDDWFVANLLQYRFGTVICRVCQNVYSSTELIMYNWAWAEYGGRLFTCPHDHELFQSNERMGELVIPMQPFKRTLRVRPIKKSDEMRRA